MIFFELQTWRLSLKSLLLHPLRSMLTVLGIFSYSKLSYELIPKFNAPFVLINTVYPGASPAEVENSVTKVIEEGVLHEVLHEIRTGAHQHLAFLACRHHDIIRHQTVSALNQIEFENVPVETPEALAALRASGKLPFDQMPLLEIDGLNTRVFVGNLVKQLFLV